MKFGFLSSGTGSMVLELLAEIGKLDDREPSIVVAASESAAIPFREVEEALVAVVPRNDSSLSDYSERLSCVLEPLEPDWIVMTFDHILKEPLLTQFRDRILNVHYSTLPAFLGREPVARAIEWGALFAGSTIHIVDEGVDTGPPLIQSSVPLVRSETSSALQDRLYHTTKIMGRQVIRWLNEDRVRVDGRRAVVEGAQYGSQWINPWPDDLAGELIER